MHWTPPDILVRIRAPIIVRCKRTEPVVDWDRRRLVTAETYGLWRWIGPTAFVIMRGEVVVTDWCLVVGVPLVEEPSIPMALRKSI